MILASVPEFDAKLHRLFTVIEAGAVVAFALEYAARIWSVVGHSLRDMTPTRARLEYAFSSRWRPLRANARSATRICGTGSTNCSNTITCRIRSAHASSG